MSCEEQIRDELMWYANGTLPPARRAAIEAHLRHCDACSGELAGLQALVGALADRPAVAAPAFEQLDVLAGAIGSNSAEPVSPARPTFGGQLGWLGQLLRAQTKLVRNEIWLASALVLVVGTLVTARSDTVLPFAIVAPVVAAGGVAYVFGPAVDPALEMELATPTPAGLVLLARLALVFAFDLLLALAASAVLAAVHPAIGLGPLVSAWLAPMSFLSGLALLITVLLRDTGLGALTGLVLWVLWNLTRSGELVGGAGWPLPDPLSEEMRPWLWALGLLLGALAIWLAGREEHWLGRVS